MDKQLLAVVVVLGELVYDARDAPRALLRSERVQLVAYTNGGNHARPTARKSLHLVVLLSDRTRFRKQRAPFRSLRAAPILPGLMGGQPKRGMAIHCREALL